MPLDHRAKQLFQFFKVREIFSGFHEIATFLSRLQKLKVFESSMLDLQFLER